MVNGTMSYLPARNRELLARLGPGATAAPPGTLAFLEDWPAAAIVLHEHAMALDRLHAARAFLADGLRDGRLSPPLRFPHRGAEDWLFGVVKVRGASAWGVDVEPGQDGAANARAFLALAASAAPAASREDPSIPASIDEPAGGALVRGRLLVRGWAQTERGPAEVLDVTIDGDRRAPAEARRTPRPDVASALPRLGDCREAGYERAYAFLPGDDGSHDLRVTLRAVDGRVRTLDRVFRWTP